MKTGRGGVEYEDLSEGTGPLAARDSTVEVLYDLKLHRGELVEKNTSYCFQLGRREIIAGLEYGVEGMREGGQRRLLVGPHLGYREQGVPGKIPANALLEFTVTLVRVSDH